jgi:hypothetical protein
MLQAALVNDDYADNLKYIGQIIHGREAKRSNKRGSTGFSARSVSVHFRSSGVTQARRSHPAPGWRCVPECDANECHARTIDHIAGK